MPYHEMIYYPGHIDLPSSLSINLAPKSAVSNVTIPVYNQEKDTRSSKTIKPNTGIDTLEIHVFPGEIRVDTTLDAIQRQYSYFTFGGDAKVDNHNRHLLEIASPVPMLPLGEQSIYKPPKDIYLARSLATEFQALLAGLRAGNHNRVDRLLSNTNPTDIYLAFLASMEVNFVHMGIALRTLKNSEVQEVHRRINACKTRGYWYNVQPTLNDLLAQSINR